MIRIEPFGHYAAVGSGLPSSYALWLPLIPDGRVAMPHFRRAPDRARAERCFAMHPSDFGSIVFADNEWACIWPETPRNLPSRVRLLGGRFALGDKIGLRPSGGTMQMFRVCETRREQAGLH